MSRVFAVLAAVMLFATIGLGASAAEAHGNSPAKRVAAGWDCFNVPGLGVHCTPPGAGASSASISLQVFDTSDPADTHGKMTSTEILIRADLYHGQPCSTDGLDEYEPLDLDGDGQVDYYACHHPLGNNHD
jgi:hypothetical protein